MAVYTDTPVQARRGIVAASVQLRKLGTQLVATTDWQAQAWRYYDTTGQARYVANAVANAISRCKLSIVRVDPDTGENLGEADDPALRPLAASPLGVGPRRRENLRLAALNLFVPGEFYLVGEHGRTDEETGRTGRDLWYIVSGFDFDKRQSKKGVICTRPANVGGGTATLNPGEDDVICRVWTPHPQHGSEADSPFRAAIPDLAVLSTIRKREAAELDSRLAGAGILVWPDSVKFGEKGLDGFVQRVTDIVSQVMDDPSDPRSLVPDMITMKPEDIEKIRHLTFWTDLSEALGELAERKVRAVAQDLDAPVEMALGQSESNHWTAWLVSEDTITTHYDPLLSRIADALTQVFLQPGLAKLGYDPDQYAYAFDTSPLKLRGDAVGDAISLYDRDAISEDALRRTANYEDGDAPKAAERARKLAIKLITAEPQLLGTPLAAVAGLNGETDPGPVIIDSTTTPGTGNTPTEAPEADRGRIGPPENPTAPETEPTPPGSAAAGVHAVANLAVARALELAGGRLVKTHPRGADRAALHTTLTSPPEHTQVTAAMRGAWRHLPVAAAELPGIDPDALQLALDTYTRGLIQAGQPHDPAQLAAWLTVNGLGHE